MEVMYKNEIQLKLIFIRFLHQVLMFPTHIKIEIYTYSQGKHF